MLGTLFLCSMILVHQGPLSCRVRLPAGSGNQRHGNAQPWVQQTLHRGYLDGVGAPAPHAWLATCRASSTRTDDLTHPDFEGFDLSNRVPKQKLCSDFEAPVIGAGGRLSSPWWQTPQGLGASRPRGAISLHTLFLHDLDPGGWPLGPPSLESPSEEDESPAPTQCLDKRVIACLCGAVWLACTLFLKKSRACAMFAESHACHASVGRKNHFSGHGERSAGLLYLCLILYFPAKETHCS